MVLICLHADMFCAIIFTICCMYIYIYTHTNPQRCKIRIFARLCNTLDTGVHLQKVDKVKLF